MDFYENTISFSDMSVSAPCCLANLTTATVTCGLGTSCAASCSALSATLCPSGHCSEDPDSCQEEEQGTARTRIGEEQNKRLLWQDCGQVSFVFCRRGVSS